MVPLVTQVSLVFQEIPEGMARLDHVVLLVRRESLGREEMITYLVKSNGNNVFGRDTLVKTPA